MRKIKLKEILETEGYEQRSEEQVIFPLTKEDMEIMTNLTQRLKNLCSVI